MPVIIVMEKVSDKEKRKYEEYIEKKIQTAKERGRRYFAFVVPTDKIADVPPMDKNATESIVRRFASKYGYRLLKSFDTDGIFFRFQLEKKNCGRKKFVLKEKSA